MADALSRVEARLDNEATNKFLKLLDQPDDVEDSSMTTPPKTSHVNEAAVKEVINRVKYRHALRAESDNPMLLTKHEETEEQVAVDLAALVTSHNIKHNLAGTDWKKLQRSDPILKHMLEWKDAHQKLMKREKDIVNKEGGKRPNIEYQSLEQYLSMVINLQDAKAYGDRQKDLVIHNDLLCLVETPKNSTDSFIYCTSA